MNDTASVDVPLEIPGGFWCRVVAKIVDNTIVFVPVCVVFTALIVLNIVCLPGLWMLVAILLSDVAFEYFYFSYFCAAGRQTPGYRYAGIKVVKSDGSNLSFGRSAARALLALFFRCVPYAYLVDAASMVKKDRRALHDRFSASKVVTVSPCRSGGFALAGLCVVSGLGFLWVHGNMQVFWLPSGSMSDTLQVNDRVVVNNTTYKFRDPRFGDIAVFKATPLGIRVSEEAAEGDVDYIKRCIGAPGDSVYVVRGVVYRKAKGETTFKKLQEPYAKYIQDGPISSYDMKVVGGHVISREYILAGITDGWTREGSFIPSLQQAAATAAAPGVIPAGQYLVLGDNRNNSNDSHSFGFVPRANFIGPAIALVLPFSRARNLD